jgi:hypothetical protein
MTTKNFILAFLMSLPLCGTAQNAFLPERWTMTLDVIDDTGQPVAGAKAWVSYFTGSAPYDMSKSAKVEGVTDTNGIFVASHTDVSFELGIHVEKSGYYTAFTRVEFNPTERLSPKRTQTLTLRLRKIEHPIPMYAKQVETKVREENEPVGFDLTAGDWVAPYGTGHNADLLLTVHRKILGPRTFNADLTLTFPNKGDGIAAILSDLPSESDFKTPRTAAVTGYESERKWRYSNIENPHFVSGYFIRVRTVLDENGNVKSALYGKVRGDFRFYTGTRAPKAGLGFDYYLNPTPNDRNLEFDPANNLLKNLTALEAVREP